MKNKTKIKRLAKKYKIDFDLWVKTPYNEQTEAMIAFDKLVDTILGK